MTQDDLDQRIADWHDGKRSEQTLHEACGMTWDEWCAWVQDPAAIPDKPLPT